MKKVLITGSTGFIGSELKRTLQGKGGFEILDFNSADGNIATEGCFEKYESEEIDHVFHLAGKTFVPDSWVNPVPFTKVNSIGTQNVLEFCRKKKLPITYVSAYVYGIPDTLPIKEDGPVKPNNPYAISKFMGEELCRFYSLCFDVKTCILRPFNVYGKAQPNHFLIPIIFEQALSEEKDSIQVKVLEPKRDYVHVQDVSEAIYKSMHFLEKQPEASTHTFNVGTGKSYSVKEVVETVQKIAGTTKKIVAAHQQRPHEVVDTIAYIEKSKSDLGWEASLSLEEGLTKIYEAQTQHLKSQA